MKSKKLLALVLAGAMVLSTLPFTAMADGSEVYYSNGETEGYSGNGATVNSTEEKAITRIYAEGDNSSVTVKSGSVIGSGEEIPVQAEWGAKITIENGGIDAKDCSTFALITQDASVTVNGDVEGGEYTGEYTDPIIMTGDSAEVTVNGNVSGGGIALLLYGGKVDVSGNVNVTQMVAESINGDIHIGGDATACGAGVHSNEYNTTIIDGELNVKGEEIEADFDSWQEAAGIWAMHGSKIIVGKSLNVENALCESDDTVKAENALTGMKTEVKIGGNLNTDKKRAIKASGESEVEVCGNVNSDVEAEMADDVTIIIGGELDGKLILKMPELPVTDDEKGEELEELRDEEESDEEESDEEEESAEEEESEEGELGKEVPHGELPDDFDPEREDVVEGSTRNNLRSTAVLHHPEDESRVPADGAAFVLYEADANNMFDLDAASLEDYLARTYYIIQETKMKKGSMSIAEDEVTIFKGIGEEKDANQYKTVREDESFTVTLEIPKGYKVKSFSAGDGIEFEAIGNGMYTVTAARGGGITLEAILQKIAKNLKVEKDTSSAPGIRVTDMAARIGSGAAKLTAKVNCSNMSYAKKQLANVRFYLDKELSDNEYYTVYLNDAGELEVELSPDLIAMIEAGYHLVEMVLDNGNVVPFDIDLLK